MTVLKGIHPLDRWQLSSAGLEEQEVSARLAERARQQATLDNRLAEALALKDREGWRVDPRRWLTAALWIAGVGVGSLVLYALVVGVMVLR